MKACTFVGFFLAAASIGALYAIRSHIVRYIALEPDQQFAVAWAKHNTTANNFAFHSRSRRGDYTAANQFYFQWWNYIVYDSETHTNYNFAYQLTDYPTNVNETDFASVSMAAFHSKGLTAAAIVEYPLETVDVTKHADLSFNPPGLPRGVHTHRFLDDDTVHVTADIPAAQTSDGNRMAWDFTFTRVHGVYTAEDNESANDLSKCGIGGSVHYGYNSLVKGWMLAGGKNVTFAHSPRVRAYGAGSWGCSLPRGDPAMEHPWAWLWLVVPGADNTGKDDLSIVFGDGRVQTSDAGSIYGTTGMVGGVLPEGRIWDARQIHLWDKGPSQRGLQLQATSSDGGLSELSIAQHDWTTFTDEYGSAPVPTRQVFTMETLDGRIVVDCKTAADKIFRARINVYNPDTARTMTFSDFRAVGVDANIKIYKKTRTPAPQTALLAWLTGKPTKTVAVDTELVREVNTNLFNAMEFAYAAPVTAEAALPIVRAPTQAAPKPAAAKPHAVPAAAPKPAAPKKDEL